MILRAIGRKDRKLAQSIIHKFPEHSVYYDLFFRAGGIFWNKPLAKYNWCNDLDGDIINFWEVLSDKKKSSELEQLLRMMPLHEELFKRWKKNREVDPVRAALRFLVLSNFSLTGKGQTFRLAHNEIKHKVDLSEIIPFTSERLQRCIFRQKDFREFMVNIEMGEKHIPKEKRFIYADSPYLGTGHVYPNTPKWTLKDSIDLFKVLVDSGIRFAMSEFAHPEILRLAKFHGLNVVPILERRSLKKRDTEILIVNYNIPRYIQTSIIGFECAA